MDEFAMFRGVGPSLTPEDIKHLIRKDIGLDANEKSSLLTMMNTPNFFEHLLVGTGGAALGFAIAKYHKMSPTSQALMSLAGFGVGNIILNALRPDPKHTQWNPERATNTIKL